MKRISSGSLLLIAAICLFFAMACNVSIEGYNNWRLMLVARFEALLVSELCCAIVFWRRDGLRWVAVLLALPPPLIIYCVMGAFWD